MRLRPSPDGHHLQHADGTPFFYLADTAWVLFNKLSEAGAGRLFADRAAKGFTVVQSCVFRDLFTPNEPNAAGVRPFETDADMRAVRMSPRWLDHVVRLTRLAGEHGIVMGLLPTWGDKWNAYSNSAGPVVMDETSAHAYCRTLSDSLGGCDNVIWILGGDSPIRSQNEADIVRAMAHGLRAGASRDRLVGYHPDGQGSSTLFAGEPWLDFNSIQSSHYKPNFPNYLHVERLYHATPAKPCIDLESNYDGIPMFVAAWHGLQKPADVTFGAHDVRKAYYRSVLAGAAGHSYGCEPIRQVHRAGDRIHAFGDRELMTWEQALGLPSSSQLALLKDALLERGFGTRVPAQELLRPYRQTPAWPDPMNVGLTFAGGENTDPAAHVRVARCREGRYAMAYLPVRQVLYVDVSGLASDRLRLTAFDPETAGVVDRIDFDMPKATGDDGEKVYTLPSAAGTLLYVPRRELDTFVVVDAL